MQSVFDRNALQYALDGNNELEKKIVMLFGHVVHKNIEQLKLLAVNDPLGKWPGVVSELEAAAASLYIEEIVDLCRRGGLATPEQRRSVCDGLGEAYERFVAAIPSELSASRPK